MEPEMVPTKLETKECELKALDAGNMYGFNVDWPHRGPKHRLKAARVIIFMSYGNQPTDTPPVYHEEFLRNHRKK